ncbi:MAG: hypothetical protein ACLFV2_05265 [Desulfurivibrionaceae bacterium]
MKDLSSIAQAKTKVKDTQKKAGARQQEVTKPEDLEMSKHGIIAILAVGGVAGLFGLLFLIGGLISAGSPLNFISQWFNAVFGG